MLESLYHTHCQGAVHVAFSRGFKYNKNMTGRIYELVKELNQFDQYFPEGMKGQSFWHYTSADGLKGILTADAIRLWFTRSDCLNDASEGGEIFALYDQVRREWCGAHPEQAAFAEVLRGIDIPKERYLLFYDQDHLLDAQPMASDAYICSFSFAGDSLDMWRYYSKGIDGYALQFDPRLFREINDSYLASPADASICHLYLFPVIYDEAQKEQVLRDKIDLCCRLYQEIQAMDAEPAGYIRVVMHTLLNSLRYCFKHPCFASENEIRAVIHLPKEVARSVDGNIESVDGKEPFVSGKMVLKHRGEGGEIPYLELSLDGRDMLQRVRLSPFIKRENAVPEAAAFLQAAGYSVPVEQSDLPVRF